ncbi:unnamed protein product [Onchocerca flexuosa]|uniref:Uncharacterized protein n=1 Tax=Onchocerca flexuosa TaxID=387005 RepID=A0A183HQ38_9BILA|nr:unnamed protein product [Onchocerca flexuosa]
MADTNKPDFPNIPVVTDEQLKNAEKHDFLKTIGNVFNGIREHSNGSEGSNGKNLTLHINLNFRKSELEKLAALKNSSILEQSN